jgi:TRAP-type C4-dicarboxylate transport system permease small subunit
VPIVVDRFNQRLQKIFSGLTSVLSAGAVIILVWGGAKVALERSSELTDILDVSVAPFRYIWLCGCVVLCGILFWHALETLNKRKDK